MREKKHLLIGGCCFLIYIIYRISTAMKVETDIIASITESDNVQCACVSRDMQNFYPNIIIFDVTLANNFQHQNVCWYWKYSWLRSKEYIYIYSLHEIIYCCFIFIFRHPWFVSECVLMHYFIHFYIPQLIERVDKNVYRYDSTKIIL